MVFQQKDNIMGWCQGTYLANEIYLIIREFIPKDKRKEISRKIYEKFCDEDADGWCGETKLEKDMETSDL